MSRKKYYRKTIPLYVLVGFDLINDVLRGSEKKVKTIEKVRNWFEIEIEENTSSLTLVFNNFMSSSVGGCSESYGFWSQVGSLLTCR